MLIITVLYSHCEVLQIKNVVWLQISLSLSEYCTAGSCEDAIFLLQSVYLAGYRFWSAQGYLTGHYTNLLGGSG